MPRKHQKPSIVLQLSVSALVPLHPECMNPGVEAEHWILSVAGDPNLLTIPELESGSRIAWS